MPDEAAFQEQLAAKDRQIAELQQRLQTEVSTIKRLVEVATMLNATLNLNELLRTIIGVTAELLHAESSSLLLLDEETQELVFQIVTDDPNQKVTQQRLPAGSGIAGWVVRHAEPAVIADPASDPRFYQAIDMSTGSATHNLVAVPLQTKDRVIGVVEAINKHGAGGFSAADLELAVALASQAAVAIDNARMYARLTEAVVTSRLSYRL